MINKHGVIETGRHLKKWADTEKGALAMCRRMISTRGLTVEPIRITLSLSGNVRKWTTQVMNNVFNSSTAPAASGHQKEMIMYKTTEYKLRNLFTGEIKKIQYLVTSDIKGLYATLDNQDDAEIVAFGLNHNFDEHILGGFADHTVVEIKKAMRGE